MELRSQSHSHQGVCHPQKRNTRSWRRMRWLWFSGSPSSSSRSPEARSGYFRDGKRTHTKMGFVVTQMTNVLLQSLASIPQIYQSIFQINRPERKTVYSEPCHVLRGEKCSDASRMFALKYGQRDLNTDVSVFDWHARLRLATRWRLAVVKRTGQWKIKCTGPAVWKVRRASRPVLMSRAVHSTLRWLLTGVHMDETTSFHVKLIPGTSF